MLDLKLIRDEPERVRRLLAVRGPAGAVELVDRVLEADAERREHGEEAFRDGVDLTTDAFLTRLTTSPAISSRSTACATGSRTARSAAWRRWPR